MGGQADLHPGNVRFNNKKTNFTGIDPKQKEKGRKVDMKAYPSIRGSIPG